MAYTISDLKQELTGVVHGTTLNKVVGLDVLIDRSARKLLEDIDPIETIRIQALTSPLFQDVYDYAIPEDVKGDRIIDIRPQVNRQMMDRFLQTYNEPFDVFKTLSFDQPNFTVQYNTAVKSVRIAKNLLAPAVINTATNITANGTWAVTDNATNLENDSVNYVYGSGSIRWDVIAGADPSNAGVENSDMTAVDLSSEENQGSIFLYVYLPTPSAVTSCTIRWGSSSTDYWQGTATTTQFGNAFQTGWNLLQFVWADATVVGAPDSSAVNYVKFFVTYDGAEDFSYRLNAVTCQLGSIYEIEYYSKFLFRNATTGAFQEKVTANSNIINLDTDSYNLLFNRVAYNVGQQIQSSDSAFDSAFFLKEYNDGVRRYVAKIKSQVLKPTLSYYQVPSQKVTWIHNSSM